VFGWFNSYSGKGGIGLFIRFVSASIYLSCWSRILSLGVMTRLLACLLLTFIAVMSNKGLRWRLRLGGLSITSHEVAALLFPPLHTSVSRESVAGATGGGIGAVARMGTGASGTRVDPTCIIMPGSFPLTFSVATPGKSELIADASTTGASSAGPSAGGEGGFG
jgi:hypothetical protein